MLALAVGCIVVGVIIAQRLWHGAGSGNDVVGQRQLFMCAECGQTFTLSVSEFMQQCQDPERGLVACPTCRVIAASRAGRCAGCNHALLYQHGELPGRCPFCEKDPFDGSTLPDRRGAAMQRSVREAASKHRLLMVSRDVPSGRGVICPLRRQRAKVPLQVPKTSLTASRPLSRKSKAGA